MTANNFLSQKAFSGVARKEPIANRKARLLKLRKWVIENRRKIHEAMHDDFRKNPTEVDSVEIFHILAEIKHAVNNLDQWVADKKVDAPLSMLGTRSFIRYEPRGVCLIISPWNYPLALCFGPLVAALAAGNVATIKPSELTPNVSRLIRRMAEEIFDPREVAVVEGGVGVASELLKLPFDHIFFTGSPGTGRIVMKAAAENLSSITLELGGKSPAIVADSSVSNIAAQRIAFAKFLNNGQTCVAPDYVLVDEKIADAFISELIAQTRKLFLGHEESFADSEHYCRIVNERHFQRLEELLKDAIDRGASIALGGKNDQATRFFHPTIVTQLPENARLWDEEIFGPIIPIITYQHLDEAISIINSKPKALALYIFSRKSNIHAQILRETSAGSVCINDCGIQFMHHNLPFGGVNTSGIGKSHGHFGFLTFSNEKAVLKQRRGFTPISMLYPPYTRRVARIMDWFLKLF